MSIDADRPWVRSYADGVSADIPPVIGSLVDMVERSIQRHAKAVAQIAARAAFGLVLPDAKGVAGAHGRRELVG